MMTITQNTLEIIKTLVNIRTSLIIIILAWPKIKKRLFRKKLYE
ncbi:MAG: hypothetical protein K0R54_4364 [Clostridiaceae bacterium]|jgi:hypothetical protein|nr:hypothetical protein [Clostridiaceae bacterium]